MNRRSFLKALGLSIPGLVVLSKLTKNEEVVPEKHTGKSFTITLPKITQPGQVITVRNHGSKWIIIQS